MIETDASRRTEGEVELNVMKAFRKILRARYRLLLCTFAGLAIGVGIALWMKPVYSAQSVFLPPKNTDITADAPVASLFGNNDITDTYLGMLASRTVADDIVDHLGLKAEFKTQKQGDARTVLSGMSKFSVGKNSLITVDVKAKNGKLAADIANAYLEALYRLNGKMAESASNHRRTFFESQLEQQKSSLLAAEADFKQVQERIGIISPGGEAQAGLNATAQLQAQIGAAETRLAGLQVSETDQNPQVVEARSQLNQLRSQLARQQSNSSARTPGSGLATTRQLPAISLEYTEKEREVRLREALYNALVQQYEKARLSSLDPGPQLQVVDRAVEPEQKSGPPKKWIALGGGIAGFLLSLAYLFLEAPTRKFLIALREPANAAGEKLEK